METKRRHKPYCVSIGLARQTIHFSGPGGEHPISQRAAIHYQRLVTVSRQSATSVRYALTLAFWILNAKKADTLSCNIDEYTQLQ